MTASNTAHPWQWSSFDGGPTADGRVNGWIFGPEPDLAHVADIESVLPSDLQKMLSAPEMFEVLNGLYDDLVRYSKMTEEVWSSGSIAFGSMADTVHQVLAKARGEVQP